ncbi:MAG: RNA methyltransferase [Mariprofundaceae bacterium]
MSSERSSTSPATVPEIAVALVHHPVVNRLGEQTTTAITTMDVHDFARTCAFYDASPVYLVHPAAGMQSMVQDICDYWLHGKGGERNPGRREVLSSIRMIDTLEDALRDADYRLWYTSASPPEGKLCDIGDLRDMPGPHLLVFGTGWGLDAGALPPPNGWLRGIEGIGKVRHLSVRAALSIYLDRWCRE